LWTLAVPKKNAGKGMVNIRVLAVVLDLEAELEKEVGVIVGRGGKQASRERGG